MIPKSLASRLLVFSLHETIMILFVFYYRQYLSKRTKFIIAIKTNTRVLLAQIQFNAELLSFRVIRDEMLVLEIRFWVEIFIECNVCFSFSGHAIEDRLESVCKRLQGQWYEWRVSIIFGQSGILGWKIKIDICVKFANDFQTNFKLFLSAKNEKSWCVSSPQKCVIACSVSVWKWIRIKFWKRPAKNTRSYGWITSRTCVSICFASRNIPNRGARCYLLTSLSQQRKSCLRGP